MADRVKYFLLGVLFLVVAGVIAYDKWNSPAGPPEMAENSPDDTGDIVTAIMPATVPVASQSGTLSVAGEGTPPAAADAPRQPVSLPAAPAGERPAPVTSAPPVTPKPTEPQPKTAPAPQTHVIRKGETLEAIAIRYYGTRDGIQWIVQANRLDNPNRIFEKQKLIIPAAKEITTAPGAAAAPAKAAGTIPSRYVVKEGDGNLYAICRRLYGARGEGARVARIMELNHLWSAEVKPGTVLILPPR
jgi:nucleoid-associated protein YgaU